jgi:hypothetical protein
VAIMSDNKTVFDDIVEGLQEIEAYQQGSLALRTRTVTPDDIDIDQLLWHKIVMLPELQKQLLTVYVDELLRA